MHTNTKYTRQLVSTLLLSSTIVLSAGGCPTNTQKTPSPNSKERIKKDSIKPTLSDRVPQGQGTPPDPSASPDPGQPLLEIGRAKKSNKDQGDSKNCPDNSEMIRSK